MGWLRKKKARLRLVVVPTPFALRGGRANQNQTPESLMANRIRLFSVLLVWARTLCSRNVSLILSEMLKAGALWQVLKTICVETTYTLLLAYLTNDSQLNTKSLTPVNELRPVTAR